MSGSLLLVTLCLVAPRVPLSSLPRVRNKRDTSSGECGVQVESRSLKEGAQSSAATERMLRLSEAASTPSSLAWELVLEVSGQQRLPWSCSLWPGALYFPGRVSLCSVFPLLVLASMQFRPHSSQPGSQKAGLASLSGSACGRALASLPFQAVRAVAKAAGPVSAGFV